MGGTSSSAVAHTKISPSAAAGTQGEKIEYAKTPEELAQGKPRCKACCACPNTRKLRDECIAANGIESCTSFIEAHNACMRKMGFNL